MPLYDHHVLLVDRFPQAHQPPRLLRLVWQHDDQCWHPHVARLPRRHSLRRLPVPGVSHPDVRMVNVARARGHDTNTGRHYRFMPADAYWTLAMAVNVYLTFYYKFDAVALRRMEIPYLLLCYGVPFIPAFVFIFVKDHGGTRVYGNALLWCWISSDWDIWRIASFYGPVWYVSSCSLVHSPSQC